MFARGQSICRRVLLVLLAIYLLALVYAGVGIQGVFGLDLDRRAMITLLIMGAPWSLTPAFLPEEAVPVSIMQLAIFCAPALNLLVMHLMCPRRRRRQTSPR